MADGRARFHEFEVLPGASVVRHRPDGGTYLSQRHISHMLVEAPKVSFEVFGLVASIPPELIRRFRYDLSARVTRSLAVSIKVVQVDNEPLGDDASRFRADDAVATGRPIMTLLSTTVISVKKIDPSGSSSRASTASRKPNARSKNATAAATSS